MEPPNFFPPKFLGWLRHCFWLLTGPTDNYRTLKWVRRVESASSHIATHLVPH